MTTDNQKSILIPNSLYNEIRAANDKKDYPMSDNQKKYEEAAKAHATITVGPEEKMIPETRSYFDACIEDFLAGASFAEKQGWNAAIDKAIDLAYNSGLGDFAVEIGKLKI